MGRTYSLDGPAGRCRGVDAARDTDPAVNRPFRTGRLPDGPFSIPAANDMDKLMLPTIGPAFSRFTRYIRQL